MIFREYLSPCFWSLDCRTQYGSRRLASCIDCRQHRQQTRSKPLLGLLTHRSHLVLHEHEQQFLRSHPCQSAQALLLPRQARCRARVVRDPDSVPDPKPARARFRAQTSRPDSGPGPSEGSPVRAAAVMMPQHCRPTARRGELVGAQPSAGRVGSVRPAGGRGRSGEPCARPGAARRLLCRSATGRRMPAACRRPRRCCEAQAASCGRGRERPSRPDLPARGQAHTRFFLPFDHFDHQWLEAERPLPRQLLRVCRAGRRRSQNPSPSPPPARDGGGAALALETAAPARGPENRSAIGSHGAHGRPSLPATAGAVSRLTESGTDRHRTPRLGEA